MIWRKDRNDGMVKSPHPRDGKGMAGADCCLRMFLAENFTGMPDGLPNRGIL